MTVLPLDVKLIPLHMHPDDRGIFAELYRDEWQVGIDVLQWNMAHSKPNVLRGVHLHWNHLDYLIVIKGHMTLFLHDVRSDSATKGLTSQIELTEDVLQAIVIPTGVAHGFYFNKDSTHIYAVSEYWNPADELGCKWDCEELNMTWPCKNPALSHRDQSAGSYQDMMKQYLEKIS